MTDNQSRSERRARPVLPAPFELWLGHSHGRLEEAERALWFGRKPRGQDRIAIESSDAVVDLPVKLNIPRLCGVVFWNTNVGRYVLASRCGPRSSLRLAVVALLQGDSGERPSDRATILQDDQALLLPPDGGRYQLVLTRVPRPPFGEEDPRIEIRCSGSPEIRSTQAGRDGESYAADGTLLEGPSYCVSEDQAETIAAAYSGVLLGYEDDVPSYGEIDARYERLFNYRPGERALQMRLTRLASDLYAERGAKEGAAAPFRPQSRSLAYALVHAGAVDLDETRSQIMVHTKRGATAWWVYHHQDAG